MSSNNENDQEEDQQYDPENQEEEEREEENQKEDSDNNNDEGNENKNNEQQNDDNELSVDRDEEGNQQNEESREGGIQRGDKSGSLQNSQEGSRIEKSGSYVNKDEVPDNYEYDSRVDEAFEEQNSHIKIYVTAIEDLMKSKDDIQIIYDEVAANNGNFNFEFVEPFQERMSESFQPKEHEHAADEIVEIMRMKGMYESETTGMFETFLPIFQAGIKKDVSGQEFLSTDQIKYISFKVFRELSRYSSDHESRILDQEPFQNEFCNQLEQQLLVFESLIADIQTGVSELRDFQNKPVTSGLLKSEIGFIDFMVNTQKFVSFEDILRLYAILNIFDYKNNFVDEPETNKEANRIFDTYLMNNADIVNEAWNTHANYEGAANQLGTLDISLFLRDMQVDDKIIFYCDNGDSEDIFSRENSFKLLLKDCDKYYFDYLGMSHSLYKNSKYVDVTQNQLWDMIRFFLNSKILFVVSKGEKRTTIDELRSELERTLAAYETKLASNPSQVEQHIQKGTIDGLKIQIAELDKEEEKGPNKTIDNKKRLYEKNLKECFYFYSKQQLTHLQSNTFAGYADSQKKMSLGEYMKFINDFKIKDVVNADKDPQDQIGNPEFHKLYKLEMKGLGGIEYENFVNIIRKLALRFSRESGSDENKKEAFQDEISLGGHDVKKNLHAMRAAFFFQPTVPPGDPHYVGKEVKLKQNAFQKLDHIKKPNDKVNTAVFSRLYKKQNNQQPLFGNSNDIKMIISPPINGNNSGNKNRYNMLNKSYNNISGIKEGSNNSYFALEKKRHIKGENKKFTWDSLEKMGLNELKGLTNMNFEPEDFIGEEDEEDKLYMKEYNLANEAIARANERKNAERKIENYGEIKNNYNLSPQIKSRYKDSFRGITNTDEKAEYIRKKVNIRGDEIARQSQKNESDALRMLSGNVGKYVKKNPRKSHVY